jgi:hypothetical protein
VRRSVLAVCALFVVASARVIIVPDSAATIAAGLGMAGYGDTVLVKPGRYEENITWPGTDGIKLYALAGPDSTTISAGASGRPLTINSGITPATEIVGFTITGGKDVAGAGVYTSGSPLIAGNRICFNEKRGERNYGGGIYCAYNASPVITGNEISDNVCADSSTWNHGGGIYVDMNSSPIISHNFITRNQCGLGYWCYGAGIYVSMRAMPFIYQNVIVGNHNAGGDRGHGAGIHTEGQALIFCNLVVDNQNASDLWNYGAGIKVNGPTAIINNTIAGNSCTGGNWADGGGIYIDYNDSALIKNNIIVQNSARGGGGICNQGVVLNLYNDVWNNAGGNYYGCAAGPGDISLDPLFATGTLGPYYLSYVGTGQPATSPCVDAGDTLLWTWPMNLDSALRSWTTRTDSVADAGALDIGFHYPQMALVGLADARPLPVEPSVLVYPNPARAGVTVTLSGQAVEWARGPVTISILDVSGRIRQTATCGLQPAVRLDLRGLPAGVYAVHLTAGRNSATQRLVVQR